MAESVDASQLLKPKAWLRYAEWLCLVITFALIADGGYKYWGGNEISSFANFMAWAIMSWVLTMVILVVYMLRTCCVPKLANTFELIMDLCILTYGCISAIFYFVKVHDIAKHSDKHVAAAVFGSFAIALFFGSLVLDIVSFKSSSEGGSAAPAAAAA